jgi:hypothetical protein
MAHDRSNRMITLRARLIAGGPYLGIFATSVLQRLIADNYPITALPVDLPGIFQRDCHAEESHSQPGGRALPCMRPRGRGIVGRQAEGTSAVGVKVPCFLRVALHVPWG